MSSTYRTLCVRTCDGYYFPISFQASSTRFPEDEQTCQRLCPAAEVALYTHRNPGEEVGQSVSLAGRPYRDLPTAFRYRQALDQACTCRKPGQSWAEALGVGRDTTIERGDIVVTEERSKAMAQPRNDAQGRPIRVDAEQARRRPRRDAARNAAERGGCRFRRPDRPGANGRPDLRPGAVRREADHGYAGFFLTRFPDHRRARHLGASELTWWVFATSPGTGEVTCRRLRCDLRRLPPGPHRAR